MPLQFPYTHPGIHPFDVAISNCIGMRVLVKSGRFLGQEGAIVSFSDRSFIVQIGEELEAYCIEDLEPIVAETDSLSKILPYHSSSTSDPPDQAIASPTQKVRRMRRRGPRVNLVGKFVRIESGRYRGEAGYVCKGGNGYYSIKFSADSANAHETVMKRSADLTPIPRPATFVEGPDFAKVVAEAAAELKSSSIHTKSSESDNEDEESAKRRKRRKGTGGTRDYWLERQVIIVAGKFRGETGTVTRSGHGFYCVKIPGRGDVMKRATDIEVYDAQQLDAGSGSTVPAFEDEIRLAAGILLDLGRQTG